MGKLHDHIRRELVLDDYGHDDIETIIQIVERLMRMNRPKEILTILADLIDYENLTPLTNNPDEWVLVGNVEVWDESHGQSLYQSLRNPRMFSYNQGETYFRRIPSDRESRKVIQNPETD